MRSLTVVVVVGLITLHGPQMAAADWRLDTALGLGQPLGAPPTDNWGDGQADRRLALDVDVTRRLQAPWIAGVGVSTSMEGWDGGIGCGEMPLDGVVIAAGIYCLMPTVAVHGLAGVEVELTRATALRLTGGVGATALFVMTDINDNVATHVAPSALVKAVAFRQAGRDWWLGLAVEGRALAGAAARTSGSAAVVVGWRGR